MSLNVVWHYELQSMCQYFGIWKEIGIRPDNPELEFDALVFLINWQAVKIAHVCRESGEKERQFCWKSAYDSQRHAFYPNGLLLQCVASCIPFWMEDFSGCKLGRLCRHLQCILTSVGLQFRFNCSPIPANEANLLKLVIKKELETLPQKPFFHKYMFKFNKILSIV